MENTQSVNCGVFSLLQDGQCRYNPKNVGATCTGYVDVNQGDENALKEAVATIGPVSIGIDAGHSSFQLYESGQYGLKPAKKWQWDFTIWPFV